MFKKIEKSFKSITLLVIMGGSYKNDNYELLLKIPFIVFKCLNNQVFFRLKYFAGEINETPLKKKGIKDNSLISLICYIQY
tara:strand:- start:217 stop:459 length:243 start_codon:yes stop_codon:yes gene_type:complete